MELKLIHPTQLGGRLDAGYALSLPSNNDDIIEMESLFHISHMVEPRNIPEVPYFFCEIGDIDYKTRISAKYIHGDEEDMDPDEEIELSRRTEKIEKGNIAVISRKNLPDLPDSAGPHVLIPTARAYLGKTGLYFDGLYFDTENQTNLYFVKDFIPIRPSEELLAIDGIDHDTEVAASLLCIATRRELLSILAGVSRWGTGYPILRSEDLKNVKINREIFDKCTSRKRVEEAKMLCDKIAELSKSEEEVDTLLKPIL